MRVGTAFANGLQRLLGFDRGLDGRLVAAFAVASYFSAVAVGRGVLGTDISFFGVPPGPSLFFDARSVTSALECRRLDYNPLVENPCDPWNRPMVYPRVWLALRWLGLDQSHTALLAIVVIAAFLVLLWLVVGRLTTGQGIVMAAALCSPSVMFAVERANMDLAVFSLLGLAVLAWRTGSHAGAMVSPTLVFLAATAKLYPALGLTAYLLSGKRRSMVTASGLLVSFGVYAILTLDDIAAISRAAPQGEYNSYGARILIARIYHLVVPETWQQGSATAQAIAMLPLLVVVVLVWLRVRRSFAPAESPPLTAKLLAFYLGTFLFLGTFAVANNFDYRLVFLLLTVPQLFTWICGHHAKGILQVAAAAALVVLIVLLWIGALSGRLLLADELVSWAMAGVLIALAAASIPPLGSLLGAGLPGRQVGAREPSS